MRRAFLLAPTAESSAVTQVPMFCPMMMGTALRSVMAPVADSACKMPTEAEELWIIAVSTAPASTPSTGFLKATNSRVNSGTSFNGATASDMVCMPNIRIAKPKRMPPTFFFLLSFTNRYRIIPTTASSGENEEGFSRRTKIESPCRPDKLSTHAVTVVPTLAPMIMPTACDSSIMPELTKPTTITVAAEEDCMIAVTAAPSRNPRKGVFEARSKMDLSLLPACFSRPSPITSMP